MAESRRKKGRGVSLSFFQGRWELMGGTCGIVRSKSRSNHSAKHQNHWRRHASFGCRAGPRVRAALPASRAKHGTDARSGPIDAEWSRPVLSYKENL